ncbi:DUF4453 domain-containing protein [Jhaorihella thermophila]|nr:DUF4453 domain-containing protein [Jhaorihella thermophila]
MLRAMFLFAWLAGSAAAGTGCKELWFTRNLIMDRAGHCFSTPLGQALFDNADCTGVQPRLASPEAALVARIRQIEARHGCRVDTSRRWLDLPDIAFRRVLQDLPIPDELGWGCLGWTGPVTPLYSGHRGPFHAIGQVTAGDYVSFSHLPVGDWAYVQVHAPVWGPFKSAGWLYWPGPVPCAAEAG